MDNFDKNQINNKNIVYIYVYLLTHCCEIHFFVIFRQLSIVSIHLTFVKLHIVLVFDLRWVNNKNLNSLFATI